MDKFEEAMKTTAKMPVAEQMKAIEGMRGSCICPGCPTYTNCAKNAREILFCVTGKSFMCIPAEKGCKCPDCPITTEMGLKYQSFCTRGAEKAQRYEHAIWGTRMV